VAAPLEQIDVDDEAMIVEAYWLARATYGAFRYADLRELPFPLYEELLDRAIKDSEEQ
jgi:hypothetical protein